MVERIEDLNLPNSVVARLIKEALPEGANVSKEARAAIARAASVFIIFLTSSSTTLARKQNHKTIKATDILEALKQLEFESFVDPLTEDLESYRKVVQGKKDTKAKQTATDAAAAAASTSSTAAAATPPAEETTDEAEKQAAEEVEEIEDATPTP